MADFWQQGPLTVPQRLRNRPIAELEGEIEAVARRRRIVLMLPAFYAEFETDAMPRILGELKKVGYLQQREMLARLVYPVVHPATEFEYSKGYYARVTNMLYGRVTWLYYTPLIRSLRRILGQNLFLSYLETFATPCPENLR
jgi:glucosyl-3-phosphoglycerate synthase